MKRVLMVAFHFPPFAGSSGVQRTLRFVRHLPAHGWQPIILTAHPRAYEATSTDLLGEVPDGVVVERAFALDTARHLALGRRYLELFARPDRWSTWRLGGIIAGRALIRRHRPAAIWSTFPIATAHVIANTLQRQSGLPWIADFRDPMVQDDYPADEETRLGWLAIENEIARHARASVFCTPGAARLYRGRHHDLLADCVEVIENGYDEESFCGLDDSARRRGPLVPGRLTLLHSGVVYSAERDPTALFAALGRLKRSRRLDPNSFAIRFRASNNDALLRSLADTNGISDMIEIAQPISYRLALEEMLRADGLIVLQSANCNEQIPGKLYEYFRAVRPILGLTDPDGDTACALRNAGVTSVAELASADEIETALLRFVCNIKKRLEPLPQLEAVRGCTRARRTEQLATLLNRCTSATERRGRL